jgi:hypothetical protein
MHIPWSCASNNGTLVADAGRGRSVRRRALELYLKIREGVGVVREEDVLR